MNKASLKMGSEKFSGEKKDDVATGALITRKKVAVAGSGYVGLSLSVLLSQYYDVTTVDIVPEKVEKINQWISPLQDEFIELFMSSALT